MNSVVLKYNQIMGRDGDFGGSITTVQDDIVAMIAKNGNNHKRKNDDQENTSTKRPRQPPLFINHYKCPSNQPYKLGDIRRIGIIIHFIIVMHLHSKIEQNGIHILLKHVVHAYDG